MHVFFPDLHIPHFFPGDSSILVIPGEAWKYPECLAVGMKKDDQKCVVLESEG